MRVRVSQAFGGVNFSYAPGQEIDVPDKVAHKYVGRGLATYVNSEDRRTAPPEAAMRPAARAR